MRPLLYLPLACLLAGPAFSAEEPIDCGDARNTVELNFCASKDYEASDAKLNDVYQKVLKQIAASGSETPYDSASWTRKLRESQKAWIAFRDADCEGAVPMEWSGGTGTSAAVLGCMTDKTDTRTKELAERFDIE